MSFTRVVFFLMCLVASPFVNAEGITTPPKMTVYKSPSCGCCAKWVDYLRDNGFRVEVVDEENLATVKKYYGVHPRLASCHTAEIDGYVIEGHVPVNDIHRLLTERPDVVGLTAPGMPQFSPGMRSLVPRGYDVLSFDQDGRIMLYSSY
ncbi:MAG: DUF411 domain-containing protein [Chromatiales bacterium]|jgi:hypothetical protein|nr:DUF411 domain-containing protein [Chromatiales bacterium]